MIQEEREYKLKKILFLIHDLGQGGAEKVLVNLVNNMDHTKFDITVMTLFDCGENKQFLHPKVKYKTWCKKMVPGNSQLMKFLSPKETSQVKLFEKSMTRNKHIWKVLVQELLADVQIRLLDWFLGFILNSIRRSEQHSHSDLQQRQKNVIENFKRLYVFPRRYRKIFKEYWV